MDVVAQWVRTTWTKQSRGAPAAARRNAAPVGFALPNGRRPIVHVITMDESDDFTPREAWHDGEPDSKAVRLKEMDGRLRVDLILPPRGVPGRLRRPPTVWLGRGEWVHWQINYRFLWSMARGGAWHYRLETLNLAYGESTVDIFLGEPTRHVDERAILR